MNLFSIIELILNSWTVTIPIIISIISLIVAWKAWSKNRAIYGVETEVLRQPTGKREDVYISTEHITTKLRSGNYTILSVVERSKSDNDWEIILGRIKPY